MKRPPSPAFKMAQKLGGMIFERLSESFTSFGVTVEGPRVIVRVQVIGVWHQTVTRIQDAMADLAGPHAQAAALDHLCSSVLTACMRLPGVERPS